MPHEDNVLGESELDARHETDLESRERDFDEDPISADEKKLPYRLGRNASPGRTIALSDDDLRKMGYKPVNTEALERDAMQRIAAAKDRQ